MSYIEGGLRDRYLFESFHTMIHGALDDLGWFDAGRKHKPINFITTAVNRDQTIPDNTLSVTTEDLDSDEAEIGSTLTDDRTMAWVDFYAESDALGRHVQGDVRDILRGKMPSIDRVDPSFMMYDMSMAAPRSVADGVLNGTTAATSATAVFVPSDVGRLIAATGITPGTTIAAVTNATTVVLSAAATASATGVTFTIGGPRDELGIVEIENVSTVRDHTPGGQRFWYAVSCDLLESRP